MYPKASPLWLPPFCTTQRRLRRAQNARQNRRVNKRDPDEHVAHDRDAETLDENRLIGEASGTAVDDSSCEEKGCRKGL